MNQEYIALGIVLIVAAYTLYRIIKTISKKQRTVCDDDACCGCSIKKELLNLPAVKAHRAKINSGEITINLK